MQPTDLRLLDVEVFEVHAQRRGTDPHLDWSVGLAPEAEPDLDARVVFGTLHVHSEQGGGEALVAAILAYPSGSDPSTDELESLLVGSEAVGSLYDAARLALRAACAIADLSVEVPRVPPVHNFSLLHRAADSDLAKEDQTHPEDE